MKNKRLILLIAAAAVAVWYFFIRKDAKTGQPTGLPFLTRRPSNGNNVASLPNVFAANGANQARTAGGIVNSGGTGGGNGIDIAPLIGAGVGLISKGANRLWDYLFSPKPPSFPADNTVSGYDPIRNVSYDPTRYTPDVFDAGSVNAGGFNPPPDGTAHDPFNDSSTYAGTFAAKAGARLAPRPQVGGVRGRNHSKATARDPEAAIVRAITEKVHGVRA